MPKGGVRLKEKEHILFGKYRLCRKLGSGGHGTVYLAYHVELETYRAVKVVPKTLVDYETFKREALFLKTLRHPGIPLVYDVEHDLNYSYLILEYLEGESIFSLVKNQGKLSMETAVDFGIQICRIIQFMNNLKDPILYLDLQPGNLLVCENTVRLTDFDHAQYAKDVRTFGERYGTIGFAAPEQYNGEPLDCRTDVFAIGALLYYMCYGTSPGKEPEFLDSGNERTLEHIIRGCMAANREDRYRSAEDVEQVLCEWKSIHLPDQAVESLNIVFVGAKSGVGTTHAALAMSSFLTRNGYRTLYLEEHDTDTMRIFLHNRHVEPDSVGVYHFGRMHIRPYYGSAVKMPYHNFSIMVKDVGAAWKSQEELPRADLYILVCGGKDWEIHHTDRLIKQMKGNDNCILLWNHLSSKRFRDKMKRFKEFKCFRLPYFEDPFCKSEETDTCFRDVLKTGGRKIWKEGNLFMRRNNRRSLVSVVLEKVSDVRTFLLCW